MQQSADQRPMQQSASQRPRRPRQSILPVNALGVVVMIGSRGRCYVLGLFGTRSSSERMFRRLSSAPMTTW